MIRLWKALDKAALKGDVLAEVMQIFVLITGIIALAFATLMVIALVVSFPLFGIPAVGVALFLGYRWLTIKYVNGSDV